MELFKCWGNFSETGRNAYGLLCAHRYHPEQKGTIKHKRPLFLKPSPSSCLWTNPQPSISLLWGHLSLLFKGKGWEVGGEGATPNPHALEQPAKWLPPPPSNPLPRWFYWPAWKGLKSRGLLHQWHSPGCRKKLQSPVLRTLVPSWFLSSLSTGSRITAYCPFFTTIFFTSFTTSCKPPKSSIRGSRHRPWGFSLNRSLSPVSPLSVINNLWPATSHYHSADFADLITSCKPCVSMPW